MRLASYHLAGRPSYGIVSDAGVVDLAPRTGVPTLRGFLESGPAAGAQRYANAAPDLGGEAIEFLPVIPDPRHIVCVGINYASHIAEVVQAGIKRATPDKPS